MNRNSQETSKISDSVAPRTGFELATPTKADAKLNSYISKTWTGHFSIESPSRRVCRRLRVGPHGQPLLNRENSVGYHRSECVSVASVASAIRRQAAPPGDGLMRQWSRLLWILPLGLVLLAIWTGHVEAALYALISLAAGIVWELFRARKTGGADLAKGLRLSRRKIRVLAYVLATFAAATTLGVYLGAVPSELVLVMLALVAAGPILAFPYLVFYWAALARSKSAESWPHTKGKVETSYMEEVVSVWPAPIVIYTYAVDERSYRSTRVRFGGTGAMNPVAAEQLLSRYPTGAQVDVFYDPKRPGQSVLIPEQDAPGRNLLWGAGLSAGAAFLGAGMTAFIVLLGLVDAVLTAVVGHRVLP